MKPTNHKLKNLRKYILLTGLLLLAACSSKDFTYDTTSNPQVIDAHHVKVVANEHYDKAGRTKRILFGDHFRKEWATPVTVEIMNFDSLEDKLAQIKMGGGFQTKSLRLEDSTGRQFVLRSINKDPSKALPPEFVGTFADDVIQDQISSSNPYAPMVVAELAGTAGIYHTKPKIVYVTRATSLGEFNEVFGNTLCLFEERPIGNQKDNPAYGYSENIVNSEKLFEKIFEDHDHQVDEQAFLRARLFDMWIGDWDRHEDQWVWASFKSGKKTVYKPIPRDRDQAFANLDGIVPHLAAKKWSVRKTQNFDYTIDDVVGLNLGGNYLDRLFTKQLTMEDWKRIATELQSQLTDSEIDSAFSKMPADIFEISGRQTIQKLKQRRHDLIAYAIEYYTFLAKDVNVLGSGDKEHFEVTREGDSTEVTVSAINKKTGSTERFYRRVFHTDETKEIKLYGLGGEDEFVVTGKTSEGILVRIIGGQGQDSVYDSSEVRGWSRMTKVYDQKLPGVRSAGETKAYATSDSLKSGYTRKNYRYDVLTPKVTPGFNPDDGVYLGGGFTFKKHQYGKAPFGQLHSLYGNYAVKTGSYNFHYDGRFTEVVGKWDMVLTAKLNAPSFIYNYYGMGNETTVTNNDWLYHRVRLNQLIIEPKFEHVVGKSTVTAGLKYQSTKLEKSPDRFIASTEASMDSTDYDRKTYGGPELGYQFSSLDNPSFPRKGIKFSTTALQMYPFDAGTNYTQLSGELSFYKTFNRLTIANRFGGSAILSDEFEFYQASTVGGIDNLRGYRRTRFAGKSSLFHNTELRLQIGQSKGYMLRGQYGLLAFFDTGRVWIPTEKSDTWHHGYGAGGWFMPYGKISITATYAVSSETNIVTITTGFLF